MLDAWRGRASGLSGAVLGQAVVSATGFGTTLVIGRVCGAAELGLFGLALSVALLLAQAQRSLLATPYSVVAPRLDDAARAALRGRSILYQTLYAAAAAVLVAVAAALLPAPLRQAGLAPVLYTLAPVLLALLLREHLRALALADLDVRAALAVDVAVAAVQLGALAGLLVTGRLRAAPALLAIAVASAAGCALSARLTTGRVRWPLWRERRVDADVRRLAGWLTGSNLVWSLRMSALPWLIALAAGTGAAGAWAACMTIATLANPIVLGINNLLGPRLAIAFADGGAAALRPIALAGVRRVAAVVAPLIALACLFGRELLEVVYGSAFGGYRTPLALLLVNSLLAGSGFAVTRCLVLLGGARRDFQVNTLALAVTAIAGYPAVARAGLTGAAALLLAVTALSVALRLHALRRLSAGRAGGRSGATQ